MATVNLGRVKPIFRGEYDPTFTYQPLDFVSFEGSTYFCLQASTGNLPSNATYFQNVLDPTAISTITRWESLTGSLAAPYFSYHVGQYWMLRVSVSDVTTHEPGVSQAWDRVADYAPPIAQPVITSPSDGAIDFIGAVTVSGYETSPRFDGAHTRSHFQASTDSGFTTIVDEVVKSNDLTTWTPATGLAETQIWLRVRYGSDEHWSDWSPSIGVTTPNTYVAAPSITAPADGAIDVGARPTLEIDSFTVVNGSDTHASTDWRILDSSGTVIWESLGDTVNLLQISVPDGALAESTTYTPQARVSGATYGASAWSAEVSFTTAATFSGTIGVAGDQGFGVGVYPDTLSNGMIELTGTTDETHDNYGNYQHQNSGSIMVFVPRFYYRIGSTESPNYADYGANCVDIAGIDTFSDTASANTAGYALHRAFIDGGFTKHGFFIDKYLCSPNGGNDAGISVKNGVPISLTSSTTYTDSGSMTGCAGELHDALTLSRARGTGFNCMSVFQNNALALLALAHGQAATGSTHCAWYDGTDTTNYPKGCNQSLADIDDAGVTFTTAGDSAADKPLTGSGSPLEKTTHNGQGSGVADVNGAIFQIALGITTPGNSGTDATAISNGDAWVLKESVALSSLTAGFGGATDAWGSDLSALYDNHTGIFPWGSATGSVYFGSGAEQVFSADTNGTNWLRTACGVQQSNAAMDAAGTNLFGQDRCYQYNRTNLFVRCAGYWGDGSAAGVFCRRWGDYRSRSRSSGGFRSSLYMD